MSSHNNQEVIFFPEGPGFIFVSKLAKSGFSKVMIVKSLKDGRLCVRKESVPYPRDPAHIIQSADVGAVQQIQQVLTVAKLLGWI